VRNYAKLAYEEVGIWLENRDGPAPRAFAHVPGLREQLALQADAAADLQEARVASGALGFETVEARPVVEAGRVTGLAVTARNRARDLIESFMVTANGAIARYLHAHNALSIARIVREPARWPRIVQIAGGVGWELPAEPDSRALARFLEARKAADPVHYAEISLSVLKLLGPGEYEVERPDEARIGHFGLAVPDYTHSTAPNRRYVDLVTQRLLKACLSGAPSPYTEAELEAIVAHCTDRENAARKVERLMRKVAAASLMSNRVGDRFDAIVTGATPKGTFVRLLEPPVEGRVVCGEAGLDVGERTTVRLLSTDPNRGFIDFENVGK
jgi:exoribonuclease-2